MSEDNFERLYDKIEELSTENAREHKEICIELQKVQAGQEHYQTEIARHQESLAELNEGLNAIRVDRARSKGIYIAFASSGALILYILERTGILDVLFGR